MANSVISRIALPTGTVCDLKDAQAREDIEGLKVSVTGAMHYIGISSTAITDGGAENPTIGGEVRTMAAADTGSVAIYGEMEYVWNGAKWQEFGSTGSLKALAFKDAASASYTPAGSVSRPSFTGSASEVNITATEDASGNYTPRGEVSQPTFSDGVVHASGTFKPTGTVAVSTKSTANKTAAVSPASSGANTYTPGGSVAAPVFTGTPATISSRATYKPEGDVRLDMLPAAIEIITREPTEEKPVTYTPSGTVAAPTISVKTAGSTTTVNSITAVGTLPSLTTAVSGETLTLGWDAGTLPTKGANTTVKTGDAAYQASAPAFTGTDVRLSTETFAYTTGAYFVGAEATIESTASYTPEGTNSAPAFTGTGVRLVTGSIPVPSAYTAAFEGAEGSVSVTGTATGTVSKPEFAGAKVRLSGSTTPKGSVSEPVFTGTQETITVS